MAINTYLSIIESKKQNKWTSRKEMYSLTQRTFWRLPDGRGVEEMAKKLKEMKKYKLVVTK